MNVKEIRKETGMSQRAFANYFEMPVKTLQQWERGGASPVPYIPKMMIKILESDGVICPKNEKLNAIQMGS